MSSLALTETQLASGVAFSLQENSRYRRAPRLINLIPDLLRPGIKTINHQSYTLTSPDKS